LLDITKKHLDSYNKENSKDLTGLPRMTMSDKKSRKIGEYTIENQIG